MKNLKSITEWIKSIFDKNGSVSSKRVAGLLIVSWVLFASSYFIIVVSKQTVEGKSLIEFLVATGASLLGLGVADSIKVTKKDKDGEKRDNRSNDSDSSV
jgi:predicted phage tail protein